MLRRICFLVHFVWYAQAEYKCVCSFDGARPVFLKADKNSDVIGFLATNGCRQFVYPVDETWNAIVFMHQLGFLMSNTSMIHTCFSDPIDSFTTDGTKHTPSMPMSTTTLTSTATQSTSRTTNTSINTSNHSTTTATKATTIATEHPTTTTMTRETSMFTTLLTYMPAASPEVTTTTHTRTTTPPPTTKTTTNRPSTTTTASTPRSTTTTATTKPQHTTTTTATKTTVPIPLTTATTITTTAARPTTPSNRPNTPASTEGTIRPTFKPSFVPEGHTELCPNILKNDVNINGGFLGQYGDYCFELVNVSGQWHKAKSHCKDAGGGYLVHVSNKAEQDYLVRFLDNHHYVQSIWLGLTDSELEGATAEGKWAWISGDPVTYTNFGSDYNSHSQVMHDHNDCVIMKQGGEWTDVPCGLPFLSGPLEYRHPYICQYNVTSKPPEIFHPSTDILIG